MQERKRDPEGVAGQTATASPSLSPSLSLSLSLYRIGAQHANHSTHFFFFFGAASTPGSGAVTGVGGTSSGHPPRYSFTLAPKPSADLGPNLALRSCHRKVRKSS